MVDVMMERVVIRVLVGGQTVDVAAFTSATPGLVVHRFDDWRVDEPWRVTHQRSGACVAHASDPETAQAKAAVLASVTDWTVTADEIPNALAKEVKRLCGAAGIGPRPASLADLNEVST